MLHPLLFNTPCTSNDCNMNNIFYFSRKYNLLSRNLNLLCEYFIVSLSQEIFYFIKYKQLLEGVEIIWPIKMNQKKLLLIQLFR